MDDNLLEVLIANLPECPNILARDKYRNSAVLVPLVDCDGEYHFLFEKRAASIRQGSEICFPGGMHDRKRDRDCRETAIRETMEELGLQRKAITVLGRFDTMVASMGATVDAFLGLLSIDELTALSLNRDEVDYVFTVPVSFFIKNEPETFKVRLLVEPSYIGDDGSEVVLFPAKELGLPEIYHKPWGKVFHRILVYKTEGETIWGITAEIIHDMISKLKRHGSDGSVDLPETS